MIILLKKGDIEAERRAQLVIEESGDWYELKKGWRARADKPHTVGMMNHNHLYFKNNQIAVINRSGTSSHNSDLSDIPNHVLKSLKKHGLLEGSMTLLEASISEIFVPEDIMQEIYNKVEIERKRQSILRGIGH